MLVEIAAANLGVAGTAQRIRSLPVLVLTLHSRCNCRCIMCDIWKSTESRELPLEVLERHRESLRALQVQWVVLTGGEPLMHSGFRAVCQFLRELGIRVTLLTAGISLQKRAEDVAYNVDDVIVSLDGPREVHNRIRGVQGAYECLELGMVRLLSLRPELRVTARTTVQKANHSALRATVQAAKDLDLSGISFLPADLTSSAFNRDEPWSEQKQEAIALDQRETRELEWEISEMTTSNRRDFESGYIAENPVKLRRIVRHFRAHLGEITSEAPMCNAPWVSSVIGPDGSVQPCFFHPAVGNIQHESLDDVLNGSRALAFRQSLDVSTNAVCRRCVCSLYRPNDEAL